MLAEQISIFIENKEGRLAEVTAILRDADVNIRALSLAVNADFGGRTIPERGLQC